MLLPRYPRIAGALIALPAIVWAPAASAQAVVTPPGAPPADLAGAVAIPKGPANAPPPNEGTDAIHAAVSAGGQFQGGNSKLYAATGQGKFDVRRGANAFGAGIIGNYAETYVLPAAGAPGTPAPSGRWQRSTENLQGKLRYGRYLSSDAEVFLQLTGTHDSFQAVGFRMNVDPGFKLLVVKNNVTQLWGEVGYDFQFDDNLTDGDGIEQAGIGGPDLDANDLPYLIHRTDTMHSSRLFVGLHEAFNKEVQLGVGLEYLQGFGGSGGGLPSIPAGYTPATVDPVAISLKASRVNFNTLLAANVGAGFSVGIGFSVKYDSQPLPGKVDVDTAGTVALIYALSSPSGNTPPKPPPVPCAPPPPPIAPPPPSVAAPAPALAAPASPAPASP